MTTTVRVSEGTRAKAAALAAERGSSIGEVVDAALEALKREEFWRQTREALAKHPEAGQADPLWERTAPDGLDSFSASTLTVMSSPSTHQRQTRLVSS